MPEITILQMIYQQKAYEGHAKDYEFSGTSMREHWQSGYEDTKRALRRKDWLDHAAPRRRHRRPRRPSRRGSVSPSPSSDKPTHVIPGPPQAEPGIQH